MNTHDVKDSLQQLDSLLAAGNQSWLLGAGISVDANIPLMYPLTERVMSLIESSDSNPLKLLFNQVKKELSKDAHIEHYLSHLGDYIALAERKDKKSLVIDGQEVLLDEMKNAHAEVLKLISDTVRYGYKKGKDAEPELIGNLQKPIVDVVHHINFINALFLSSQGVSNRRRAVRLPAAKAAAIPFDFGSSTI